MPKETKASDSSTKLEDRLDPLHDVALVIVHVNDHYGSVVCCKNPIKNILNARVASNVYEHVSHYQSFLGSEIGVKTQWKQRYIVSRI